MKIAIIGSGISGLATAWLLRHQHDITLYEKSHRPGGHARTIDVKTPNGAAPVDTGFIVLNDRNYPNLMGLFKALGVEIEKSNMSFGVSINQGWLEYSSNGLFEQKRNILRPRFWSLLRDILRFNKQAVAHLSKAETSGSASPLTLAQFVDDMKLSQWFRHYYLYAMAAAIWSCPARQVQQMPALTFLRFFNNHGLLGITNRPQWYTVTGGSRAYVNRLTKDITQSIRLDTPVERVTQNGSKLTVTTSQGEAQTYDHVIFSCHADQAATMLDDASPELRGALGSFAFTRNHAVTHSDISFMPRREKAWASWVYLEDGPEGSHPGDASKKLSLTYWMNNLQNLDPDHPILITLNPAREPQSHLIHDEHNFYHPVFDQPAIEAQEKIKTLQGENNLWFTGAWLANGFHEDGIKSAVEVANQLRVRAPWQ